MGASNNQEILDIDSLNDFTIGYTQSSWINVSTMGHVAHGKSTLVGFLLWKLGYFSTEDLERQNGLFAHLMDRLFVERKKSLTVQESLSSFKITEDFYTMIVDNPGHYHFIKNLVNGLTVSQAGIIVIACSDHEIALDIWRRNDLMAKTKPAQGRYPTGTARMQLYIARWLGLGQFFVVISKMDQVDYNKDFYMEAAEHVREVLTEIGLDPNSVPIVPTAINDRERAGENIVEFSEKMPWAKTTLLNALKGIKPEWYYKDLPLRGMVLENLHRVPGKRSILRIYMRQGSIAVGDRIVIIPREVEADVISIWEQDKSRKRGHTENTAALQKAIPPMLVSLEIRLPLATRKFHVKKGSVVCRKGEEPVVTNQFVANVLTMPSEKDFGRPQLSKGHEFTIEMPTTRVPASLEEVLFVRSLDGKIETFAHDALGPNNLGRLCFNLRRPTAIDTISTAGGFSRFVFRSGFWTFGGGVILNTTGIDLSSSIKQLRDPHCDYRSGWSLFEKVIFTFFSSYPWLICEYQSVVSGMRCDIFVQNYRKDGIWEELGQKILVECKYWSAAFGPDTIFKIAGQLNYLGAKSAIIASLKGSTKKGHPGALAVAGEFYRRGTPILLMVEEDIIDLLGGADIDEILSRMRRRLL